MPKVLRLSDRCLDLDTGRLENGTELRPMELRVLRYLVARAEQPVSYRELLASVWGYAEKTRTTTVYSTVYRLRQVLEPQPDSPRYLVTVTGKGVKLTGLADVPARRTNLQPALDTFVGRAALLERLATDARLVTLLGIGGAGKTRLAVEHARRSVDRFAAGCWSCDLTTAATVEAVAERIADVLRLDVGTAAELGPALALPGRLLIVLDNLELPSQELGPWVSRWLADAPQAHFVVTSRAPLGIAGEQRLLVGPLGGSEHSDARALFLDRARAADPTFQPTQPLQVLLEALDHLPLAIELAASHAASVGPSATLAALEGQGALRSSRTDRPGRHRSLDDVVSWSWQGLSGDLQHGLSCLAVFAVSFSLDAVQAVLDATEPTLDAHSLVVELQQRGLLQRLPSEGPPRFKLSAIVARFLKRHPAPDGAVQGHTDFYAAIARRLFEDNERTPPAADPHAGREVDEVLAVARRMLAFGADAALPLVLWGQIAATVARRTSEVATLTAAALDAAPSPLTRVLLEMRSEIVLRRQGRRRQASELRMQLIGGAAEAGRADLAADLEVRGAMDHRNRGDFAQARHAVARALRQRAAVVAPTAHSEARFWGTVTNVRASLFDSKDPEAIRCYREAIAHLEDCGDLLTIAAVRANLGGVLVQQERYVEAEQQIREALQPAAQNHSQRASALGKLSVVLSRTGERAAAEETIEAALALASGTADPSLLAYLWTLRARLDLEGGALEVGLTTAHRALALVRDAEEQRIETVALYLYGKASRALGRPDAEGPLHRSLQLAEAIGARWLGGPAALELVQHRIAQSQPEAARALIAGVLAPEVSPLRAADALLLRAEIERRAGEGPQALESLHRVADTGSPRQAARATLARDALRVELGHPHGLQRLELPPDASPWLRVLAARLALGLRDGAACATHLDGLHLTPGDTLLWLAHHELTTHAPSG